MSAISPNQPAGSILSEESPAIRKVTAPGYKPIETYGIIGDLHSVALVGLDGSIDWCCLPRFDSPSVFGAILDQHKGGYCKLATVNPGTRRQMYLPATNVLLTRFLSGEGVGEVTDFMPVQAKRVEGHGHQIVRIARAVRGEVHFRFECRPAFDFARRDHQITLSRRGAMFDAGTARLALLSPVPLRQDGPGAFADFVLQEGETLETSPQDDARFSAALTNITDFAVDSCDDRRRAVLVP